MKTGSDIRARAAERGAVWHMAAIGILIAIVVALLLTNITARKVEAETRFVRVVDVDESIDDPAVWGKNWPHQYDRYLKTALETQSKYGGTAVGPSDGLAEQKLETYPWLKRIFAGYAFSIDYRDRRGHSFMLSDQEVTKRITERKQPGACLQCHASNVRLYRHVGNGDARAGFEKVCGMPYEETRALKGDDGRPLVQHPVACIDCHDPETMRLRVTRPAFVEGIAALKALDGKKDYDVNKDATRHEMRSFVCAQCHNEYYFKPKGKLVAHPWSKGLLVEQQEAFYDEIGFSDWTHAETGAKVLKAQHPEFEVWSQGIHAKANVSCSDCHMPYERIGATKVSDHWVRSPLTNIARACLPCHGGGEAQMLDRVHATQDRHHALLQRAATAMTEMLDAIKAAKAAGAPEAALEKAYALHRRAQWRLDFVAAENSMGFHAPQELARILAEAIDFARQAQVAAAKR